MGRGQAPDRHAAMHLTCGATGRVLVVFVRAGKAESLVIQEPEMAAVSYDGALYFVRRDLADAHVRAWDRLAWPGTWLDAATRIAVSAAAREARTCRLCQRRKQSVSPNSETGEHDDTSALPVGWIDIVHRIAADPGRLTRGWFDRAVGGAHRRRRL